MLEDILAYIEGAHPVVYFGLLMCAGFGLPVSEDALAIWAGGLIGREQNPFGGTIRHCVVFRRLLQ